MLFDYFRRNATYVFNLWALASIHNKTDEKFSIEITDIDILQFLEFINIKSFVRGNWLVSLYIVDS